MRGSWCGRTPKIRRSSLGLLIAALVSAPATGAAFDEFGDDASPTYFRVRYRHLALTLKGELELELHDLEGRGGPGYDSPTDTRTIGTRSAFVEIDSLRIALRLGLSAGISINSFVELTTRDARVGAVWLDYRGEGPAWLRHHVEAGYETPIVAIDRRTERYPLIGTIYWRQPELHASWEGEIGLAAQATLTIGLSLAMMRPLDFAGVQDATSQPGAINVLSYGAARAFSGNGAVGGGTLRISASGVLLEGFGFGGRLAAEAGTDVLRSGFPNYRDLPGSTGGEGADDGFFWAGGRLGYQGHRITALVEAIASREGLIRRWGLYGQLSYAFPLRAEGATLFHALETLVRYEVYRVRDSTVVHESGRALRSTAPINAVSWDYDVLTIALILGAYRDMVTLRLELSFIDESNGVPSLGLADAPFRNNELLLQAELRF